MHRRAQVGRRLHELPLFSECNQAKRMQRSGAMLFAEGAERVVGPIHRSEGLSGATLLGTALAGFSGALSSTPRLGTPPAGQTVSVPGKSWPSAQSRKNPFSEFAPAALRQVAAEILRWPRAI
jgi:hypothetical protein